MLIKLDCELSLSFKAAEGETPARLFINKATKTKVAFATVGEALAAAAEKVPEAEVFVNAKAITVAKATQMKGLAAFIWHREPYGPQWKVKVFTEAEAARKNAGYAGGKKQAPKAKSSGAKKLF